MDRQTRLVLAGQIADKVLMVGIGSMILFNQRRARIRDEAREVARQEVFRALSDDSPSVTPEEVLAGMVDEPADPLWEVVRERARQVADATDEHHGRIKGHAHEHAEERMARRNKVFRNITEAMNPADSTRGTNR